MLSALHTVPVYGEDQAGTSEVWVLETEQDSDDVGTEGRESDSRSIHKEGKEMLSRVNTDGTININRKENGMSKARI